MLLEQTSHFKVLGEAEDGESAIAKILEIKPEVVMMDLGLPKIDGIQATNVIKESLPDTKILIFTTAEDDSSIFSALKAGADGYCLKTISGEMLATAIESVLSGAAWLDPGIAQKVLRSQKKSQEISQKSLSDVKLQLLTLVERGRNLEEIAQDLRVNDLMVKELLNELLSQFKSGSPSQAADPGIEGNGEPNLGPVKAGEIIGQHYVVEKCIGQGGLGTVYRATHNLIDRIVAIKTLHADRLTDKEAMSRFKSEAESNASVVHPNLATIYDFGLIHGKIPYIAMEYLEGQTLQELIVKEGSLDETSIKEIFIQICDALDAVHSKGIIHRDLKPGNIMLIKKGDKKNFVKLLDFGIAKIADSGKLDVTQPGVCMGSPLYMSPEQCGAMPGSKLSPRSDLYSLGCMLYESLSGSPPFEGESMIEVVIKHINQPVNTALLEEKKIEPRLISLVTKLLSKDPAMRPSSAAAVRDELLKGSVQESAIGTQGEGI